jgi:hypothetical protein
MRGNVYKLGERHLTMSPAAVHGEVMHVRELVRRGDSGAAEKPRH